jgi:hypothetical protein
MALRQTPHHVSLARRPECGADLLGLLHRYQAVNDVAALHQQVVNLLVDGVDLFAQFLQRWGRGGDFRHGCNLSAAGRSVGRGPLLTFASRFSEPSCEC